MSILNDVNALIAKRVGDLARLEHIKETIENNKQLYDSDRKYLDGLIEKHLFSKDQSEHNSSSIVPENQTKPDQNSKNEEKEQISSCVNCGKLLENDTEFCPSCDDKKNKTHRSNKQIPTNKIERTESVLTATFLGIIGFIVLLIGFGIVISSLEMPAMFAGQYIILGLFVVVIGGVVIYGAKRIVKKKKSHFVCGYCGYIAATERELYNHSLVCEKKLAEES